MLTATRLHREVADVVLAVETRDHLLRLLMPATPLEADFVIQSILAPDEAILLIITGAVVRDTIMADCATLVLSSSTTEVVLELENLRITVRDLLKADIVEATEDTRDAIQRIHERTLIHGAEIVLNEILETIGALELDRCTEGLACVEHIARRTILNELLALLIRHCADLDHTRLAPLLDDLVPGHLNGKIVTIDLARLDHDESVLAENEHRGL